MEELPCPGQRQPLQSKLCSNAIFIAILLLGPNIDIFSVFLYPVCYFMRALEGFKCTLVGFRYYRLLSITIGLKFYFHYHYHYRSKSHYRSSLEAA